MYVRLNNERNFAFSSNSSSRGNTSGRFFSRINEVKYSKSFSCSVTYRALIAVYKNSIQKFAIMATNNTHHDAESGAKFVIKISNVRLITTNTPIMYLLTEKILALHCIYVLKKKYYTIMISYFLENCKNSTRYLMWDFCYCQKGY